MKKFKYNITTYSVVSILVLIVIAAFLIGNNFIVDFIRNVNIDVRTIRNEYFSSFSTDIDDFLQFVPAILMLTLTFCNYKGDMGNKQFAIFLLIATAITQLTVYTLKIYIGELRPDESDYLSFPSGHSATAFMIATMLSLQYRKRSIFYSIFGYSCAIAVALMRILNNRHWIFDTIIGATLGILLTYWAYRVTKRKFFIKYKQGQ